MFRAYVFVVRGSKLHYTCIITPIGVMIPEAHHQEVKIALHSLWCDDTGGSSSGGQNCITQPLVSSHLYHHTYRCDDTSVMMPEVHHQEVKIALHSLWYHHTYRCDDTRGCVMQFWPPEDEHMCSKHVEAWNKLIVKRKFCASSWLITETKMYYPVCLWQCSVLRADSVHSLWGAVGLSPCLVLRCSIFTQAHRLCVNEISSPHLH